MSGNNFKEDDAFGKEAVDALVKKFPWKYEYITDEEEQRTCGDLRELKTGRHIEVKHDRYKPVNFFFEEWSDWGEYRQGWVRNLDHCDELIYKFKNHPEFYVMPFIQVRNACWKRRAKQCEDSFVASGGGSKAWGWLVPLSEMKGRPGWDIL